MGGRKGPYIDIAIRGCLLPLVTGVCSVRPPWCLCVDVCADEVVNRGSGLRLHPQAERMRDAGQAHAK